MGVVLGPVTTKNEAARALIAAAELQAVLDYRNALYENTVFKNGDYIVEPSRTITECERFLNELGFEPYKMLKPKVIELKKLLTDISRNKDRDTCICPICNGLINIHPAAQIISRKDPKHPVTRPALRASCSVCQFKTFI